MPMRWVILSLATVLGNVIDDCQQCLSSNVVAQPWSGLIWSDGRCPEGRSPLVGPADYAQSLVNGLRCCATKFGDKLAECETTSCQENFGGIDNVCSNFGSDLHGSHPSCPYSKNDRAICDVSYYIFQNEGLNCRKNSAGNCLGKVKCNTDGVILVDGHSNGTASGGGGICAGSSGGFAAGADCFYDGQTENWKVCSSNSKRQLLATPTNKPTVPTSCQLVGARKWCVLPNGCGISCNEVCSGLGLTLTTSDQDWFEVQNTREKCQAINDAFGLGGVVTMDSFSNACVEDVARDRGGSSTFAGSLTCSTSASCANIQRTSGNSRSCSTSLSRLAVCPCNEE